MENPPDPLVGVDRNGAFFHDDFVACDGAGNFGDYGFDIREVGGSGLALRRADCDKDRLTPLNRPG